MTVTLIGSDVWSQGIAPGRPGRWHGRLERRSPLHNVTGAPAVLVEIETCPHEHRTRQAADACGAKALARVVHNGEWLDDGGGRRYRRTTRP